MPAAIMNGNKQLFCINSTAKTTEFVKMYVAYRLSLTNTQKKVNWKTAVVCIHAITIERTVT